MYSYSWDPNYYSFSYDTYDASPVLEQGSSEQERMTPSLEERLTPPLEQKMLLDCNDYDCDYSYYDDEEALVPLNPWSVAIWSFAAVGICLNAITITVFLQQGRVAGGTGNRVRLNPALLQLVLLSLSDVLMLVGLIVIRLDIPGKAPRNVYETFLELNAWCTVMIAVTRCFAVSRPFQYFLSTHRSDANKSCILSLLTPILLTVLTEVLNHVANSNVDSPFYIDACDESCLKILRWIFALFRFFLPFSLILVSAVIISIRLWHQPVRLMRHQSFMTNGFNSEATEMTQLAPRRSLVTRVSSRDASTATTTTLRATMPRRMSARTSARGLTLNPAVNESIGLVQRITRMSLGVVVMYFVTHILDFIFCLHHFKLFRLESVASAEGVSVNYLLLAFNSSSNLFIYLWLSADFKHTFLHLFCCGGLHRLNRCTRLARFTRLVRCSRRRGNPCRRRSTGSTSVSGGGSGNVGVRVGDWPPAIAERVGRFEDGADDDRDDDAGNLVDAEGREAAPEVEYETRTDRNEGEAKKSNNNNNNNDDDDHGRSRTDLTDKKADVEGPLIEETTDSSPPVVITDPADVV